MTQSNVWHSEILTVLESVFNHRIVSYRWSHL